MLGWGGAFSLVVFYCYSSVMFLTAVLFCLFAVTSGSPLGCTTQVKEGAVPNEHGTWLYGRGGWCDGLQVDPWRVDVTKQVPVHS